MPVEQHTSRYIEQHSTHRTTKSVTLLASFVHNKRHRQISSRVSTQKTVYQRSILCWACGSADKHCENRITALIDSFHKMLVFLWIFSSNVHSKFHCFSGFIHVINWIKLSPWINERRKSVWNSRRRVFTIFDEVLYSMPLAFYWNSIDSKYIYEIQTSPMI